MSQIIENAILTAIGLHSAYGYRASTQATNELIRNFDQASKRLIIELRELLDDLTEAEKKILLSGRYTTETLRAIRDVMNEWSEKIATDLPMAFDKSSLALALHEATFVTQLATGTAQVLNGEAIYKQAVKKPLAGGQLVSEMFAAIATKVRSKVEYAIRDGINTGQTNQEIVSRIRGKRIKQDGEYKYVGGVWDTAKSDIERTVRTARSHVANAAYSDTWKALGFEYVKFVAVLDGRTSKVCASLDAKIYRIDEPHPIPPLHYNCRSVLVGCDADGNIAGMRPFVADERRVKDIPKDERDGKIGQVDANTSFKEFFSDQSKDFQLEWLGPSKYKLYKEGGYSIDRFVDPLGKEYTLKQLKALDEKTFKELGL